MVVKNSFNETTRLSYRMLAATHLKANIPSLAVFDYLRYVEATAKLQPPSNTQTQPFTMRPIQTNLLQLSARQRPRKGEGC